MAASELKFDVAISFLSDDLQIAEDFNRRLRQSFSTFFYPHKQDDLAGDGAMADMRVAFREASRVNLILYRGKWGLTPWTRFEQQAIKDRCMEADGWDRLVVVSLDGKNPPWVPSTFICVNLAEFGIEQAIGAIKARVLAEGGKVERMTTAKRVELHKEMEKFQTERQGLQNTSAGNDAMGSEIVALFKEIERQGAEAVAAGAPIRVGYNAGRCVMTNDRQSLIASWQSPRKPGIAEDRLKIEFYRWNFAMPGDRPLHYYETPKVERPESYELELTMARDFVWKNSAGELFTSAQLAEGISLRFFDFVEEVISGPQPDGRPRRRML